MVGDIHINITRDGGYLEKNSRPKINTYESISIT